MDSAGFLGRETCLEQYFRETEASGADCDDVSVRRSYHCLNLPRPRRPAAPSLPSSSLSILHVSILSHVYAGQKYLATRFCIVVVQGILEHLF